jgi:hypothetical protein
MRKRKNRHHVKKLSPRVRGLRILAEHIIKNKPSKFPVFNPITGKRLTDTESIALHNELFMHKTRHFK